MSKRLNPYAQAAYDNAIERRVKDRVDAERVVIAAALRRQYDNELQKQNESSNIILLKVCILTFAITIAFVSYIFATLPNDPSNLPEPEQLIVVKTVGGGVHIGFADSLGTYRSADNGLPLNVESWRTP